MRDTRSDTESEISDSEKEEDGEDLGDKKELEDNGGLGVEEKSEEGGREEAEKEVNGEVGEGGTKSGIEVEKTDEGVKAEDLKNATALEVVKSLAKKDMNEVLKDEIEDEEGEKEKEQKTEKGDDDNQSSSD